MLLLLEIGNENLVLGLATEPLEVLIFGVGLVVLAIGLRAVFKRVEKSADGGKVIHRTK